MMLKRIGAVAAAALLTAGIAGGAGAERMNLPSGNGLPPTRALHSAADAGRECGWWGVLYGDAALLARAAEEEEEPPETETEIEFIWPLWGWLLSLLGLN